MRALALSPGPAATRASAVVPRARAATPPPPFAAMAVSLALPAVGGFGWGARDTDAGRFGFGTCPRRCARARSTTGEGGEPAGASNATPDVGAEGEACLMAAVERARFEGVERTYGAEGFARIAEAHVAVLGIGGVGSWAAEAVARSGVGAITLVDLDEVCVSNVNRQVHALQSTVGRPKGEVMRERILEINPGCHVTFVQDFIDEHNFEDILSRGGFDFVIDAIDQPKHKCRVIAFCYYNQIPVLSTGGAGGIDNPGATRIADLNAVDHDGLLLRVRKNLRRRYGFPKVSKAPWGVPVVTTPNNSNVLEEPEGGRGVPTGSLGCAGGAGSVVYVTGAMGLFAASHCINELVRAGRKDRGGEDAGTPSAGGSEGGGAGEGEAPVTRALGGGSLIVGDGIAAGTSGGARGADSGATSARVARGADAEGLGGGALARGLALFDAHSHVHLGPDPGELLGETSLYGIALHSTLPGEWGALADLAAAHSALVRPAYGVHPWYTHRDEFQRPAAVGEEGGWLGELRARLEADPRAIVGEMGLDKSWVTPDTGRNEYGAQRHAFEAQLALAAGLGRPACLHCVRAHGDLASALAAAPALPPRVYLHSYTGSAEMVQQFQRLERREGEGHVYFGFSHAVNSRSPKTPKVIKAVPDDRILLESDRSDGAGLERELVAMLAAIADAKGWSLPHAAEVTRRNAEAFYAVVVVVAGDE